MAVSVESPSRPAAWSAVASHPRLDRTVALKIMHAELANDEDFVRRFVGEARSAARRSTTPTASPSSTRRPGRPSSPWSWSPAAPCAPPGRGPCPARRPPGLARGHGGARGRARPRARAPRRQARERDGPRRRRRKVLDFGIARMLAGTSHTKTGMLIGTAAYLAPEQVSRGVADARTDVYAAGVMLFEMLTGRQPHTADTPLAAFTSMSTRPCRPLAATRRHPARPGRTGPPRHQPGPRSAARRWRAVRAQPQRGAAEPPARSPGPARRAGPADDTRPRIPGLRLPVPWLPGSRLRGPRLPGAGYQSGGYQSPGYPDALATRAPATQDLATRTRASQPVPARRLAGLAAAVRGRPDPRPARAQRARSRWRVPPRRPAWERPSPPQARLPGTHRPRRFLSRSSASRRSRTGPR